MFSYIDIKHCYPQADIYRKLSHAIKNIQALRSQCTHMHRGWLPHWLYKLDNITHCNPKAETYRELSSNRTQSQFGFFQIMPLIGLPGASQEPGGL